MANDITTLAIALQSREAETNLKTFNELLTAGSKNAKAMENMKIGVDVNAALKELEAFKASYENIAKTAENVHFNMPTMFSPSAPTTSTIDLDGLKTIFQQQEDAVRSAQETMAEEMRRIQTEAAEEMQRRSEAINEVLEKIGAGAERAGGSVRSAGESMRGAGAAAGEYAVKLREVNAAKKELAKLSERADADGKAAYEADQRAREAKHNLLVAERELQKVSEQLSATHTGGAGNIMKLAEQEEALQNEVNSLSEAYKKAQAEADKFNAKLDVSAGKADEARARYNQLQAELAGIPAPAGKAGKSIDAFSVGAKHAGASVTKFARGFSALALYSGVAVPKLAGLGRAISMFSITGPYVGAAVVGIMGVSAAIKKIRGESEKEAQTIRETAELASKIAQESKQFVSESENDWKRLGELSGVGSLTNTQNQEATAIIQRLSETYGDLGIEIDKTTGKLMGYMVAREAANAKEREMQEEMLRFANDEAQRNLKKQIESASQGVGNRFMPGALGNPGSSDIEKLRAINQQIERLSKAASGEIEIKYLSDAAARQLAEQNKGKSDGENINYETFQSTLSKKQAQEILKNLESVRDGFIKATNAKEALEKFNTSDLENYGKSVGKIADQIAKAESAFIIDEDGAMRRKTDEESYKEMLAQKRKLFSEMLEAEQFIKENGEQAYMENGKQAGIALNEIKLKQAEINGKILDYEKKISDEREKQRKTMSDAISAEKKKLEAIQAGYKLDKNGALKRKKNADEISADRNKEIAKLQQMIAIQNGAGRREATEKELSRWGKRYNPLTGKMDGDQKQAGWRGILSDGKGGVMTEVSTGVNIGGKEVEIPLIVPDSTREDLVRIAKIANGELTEIPPDLMEKAVTFAEKRLAEGKSPFFNGDKADESIRKVEEMDLEKQKEIVGMQVRLAQLQSEQSTYRDQVAAAGKQNAAARKSYVFDEKTGAVLRKKTEEELQAERKKEIEAARARVRATEAGTLERAKAQAELDRLAIEEYNDRKKMTASMAFQDVRAENTRLVRGIEARSTEALALEARSFRRDDSEKTILKDTMEVETDIRDISQQMLDRLYEESLAMRSLSEKFQSL